MIRRQGWNVDRHRIGGAAVGRAGRDRLHVAGAFVGSALVFFGALFASVPEASALEVAGVSFDERRRTEDTDLELNGAGLLRYRVFIKAYVAALYTEPDLVPERVLDDVPKRIEIEYFWDIPAEALRKVTRERVERGASAEQRGEIETALAAMNALYPDIQAGDRLSITYLPGRGTELAHNDVRQGIVPGAAFARAMFGVWLGEDPVDDGLRARLLADAR